MYFDLSGFLRMNFKSLFRTRGQQYRLTPKRLLVLFIWLLLYIPAQMINRICFLLDELLFPRYRQQVIDQPVFIIGNPRSGTTFLHRLIFQDKETFTSFSVWELIFAPSITQRKLISGLRRLLLLIGYPIKRITNRIDKRLAINKSAHKISLNDAEEDEHILIHAWSSETLWPLYPIKEDIFPYFFFDREIPIKKQEQIMKFYESMLKRHLYAHGGRKRFLSKNPSHTGKIAALQRFFPDARFIHLARTPFEALPSMMNYMAAGWNLFCDPIDQYPYNEEFFEVMNFYYLYPIEYFQNQHDACYFLKYDEILRDPESAIGLIYDWLDLRISDEFAKTVHAETQNARQFVSHHTYSIADMGLSEAQIFSVFADVFSYYEFESHQQELPDRIMLWQLKDWRKYWKHHRLEKKATRVEKRRQKKQARQQRKQQKREARPSKPQIK